jgi:hypothetical protein
MVVFVTAACNRIRTVLVLTLSPSLLPYINYNRPQKAGTTRVQEWHKLGVNLFIFFKTMDMQRNDKPKYYSVGVCRVTAPSILKTSGPRPIWTKIFQSLPGIKLRISCSKLSYIEIGSKGSNMCLNFCLCSCIYRLYAGYYIRDNIFYTWNIPRIYPDQVTLQQMFRQ